MIKRTHAIETLRKLLREKPLSYIVQALGPDADLHIVGGTVREALLGTSPTDIDLATVLTAEATLARLERASIRAIPTALHHGTVTAVIDEIHIEITTFRSSKGSVQRSIIEDLSERDFTINALAFPINDPELLDPHNGADDLQNKTLRCVGSAQERFKEDPLRMLRMVRFGTAAGRTITDETMSAALALHPTLQLIAIERVKSEFEKILTLPYPAESIEVLRTLHFFDYFIQELLVCVGFVQNEFHDQDVYQHILTVLRNADSDKLLRLASLFHDIAKPLTLTIAPDGRRHFYCHEDRGAEVAATVLERLKFSSDDCQRVSRLVEFHMRPLQCGPAAVRRLLKALDQDFDRWRLLKMADRSPAISNEQFSRELEQFDGIVAAERERLKGNPLQLLRINGEDLKLLGLVEGPTIGKVLRKLQEIVFDTPEQNEKALLIEHAKAILDAETHG